MGRNFLLLQCLEGLLHRGDLALGIGFFLTLVGNNGLGGVGDEALVAQLLIDAGKEAAGIGKVGLEFLDLSDCEGS